MQKPTTLPRSGDDLKRLVQVVLMCEGNDVNPRVLSRAIVRRDKVVQLIQTLKDNGHPAYKTSDMDEVSPPH